MIKTSGNEKTHYTVVLACCADGTKLPPLLTHLCLTFHYWNGSDVGVIYILLRKVIAESDFSPMSASRQGTLSRGAQS